MAGGGTGESLINPARRRKWKGRRKGSAEGGGGGGGGLSVASDVVSGVLRQWGGGG